VGATSLSDKLTVGDGTISTDAVVRINGGSNTGKGSGIRLMKAGTAYAYIGSTSWLLGTGTSNNLSLSTTGLSDLTLDSSGNLGLGVTPSAWATLKGFDISSYGGVFGYTNQVGIIGNAYYGSDWTYKANGPATYYYQSSGTHAWFNAPSGTAGNAITFTQAMTLTANGALIIGATALTPQTGKFKVVHDTGDQNIATSVNSAASSPYGNVISFTGASPNNGTNYFLLCADTTATRAQFYSNGGLANYSANNVNLSDRREKTNFAPATSYLDKICAIPVQTFNYLDQNLEQDDGLTLGVVAQDVQAVAPELVTETNWGTVEEPKMRLSIYQTDLQYALMKCIQEQQALIQSLKARLDAANL